MNQFAVYADKRLLYNLIIAVEHHAAVLDKILHEIVQVVGMFFTPIRVTP